MAPAWPNKDAPPEELRNRHPDAAIASNRLDRLADHFEVLIRQLPEQPIMIGHSLGGLVVQLLLQKGIAKAGVAIHSFPPNGVDEYKLSFIKAVLPAMGFFTSSRKSYMISFRKWKQIIANSMTCEQQKELFYKYAIPESKLIVRDSFRLAAKINFRNERAPLLLTSGGRDRVVPASVNYDNYKNYRLGKSITDYKEFRSHNHLIFDQPSLKEEADFILYWLEGIQ